MQRGSTWIGGGAGHAEVHPSHSLADLLWVLASMGHGDDLALVDANHPATAIARSTASGRLITLPGLRMAEMAAAILTVLPIDEFEPAPVRRMQVVGAPEELPAVQREVQVELTRAVPGLEMQGLERFAFYAAARAGFAVVQVGDARPYGCFLLRKGVITLPG